MLSIASRSIDIWVGVSGGDRMSGGVLDPFFQAGLLCAGGIILASRKLNWSNVVKSNAWLFLLVGYMLVSVLWSDMPLRSFRSWVKEVVAIIMACVVLTQPAPQQALQSILRRTVYVLIPFSILLVKYYPDLGVVYSRYTGEIQWIGVTVQKNSLGQLCLVSTFFLVWTLVRRWQGRDTPVGKYQTKAEVLLLIITLWLLRGPSMWAASATGIVALSFGLGIFFGLLWMKKHRIQLGASAWVTVAACIIGLGIITPLVGGSTVTGFTSALGRDATLTGRTDIWAGLLPDLMRQPMLGYGFSGFWTIARINEHQIGEAHNGYLDVCLQLGVVGLLLTAAFLLSCVRKAHRVLGNDFDWGSLALAFVLMIVVESIADSSIDSFTKQIMAIVLFLSVSVPAITKRHFTYQHGSVAETGGFVPGHHF
jgi:exopolysaccharide production protein ExoQ